AVVLVVVEPVGAGPTWRAAAGGMRLVPLSAQAPSPATVTASRSSVGAAARHPVTAGHPTSALAATGVGAGDDDRGGDAGLRVPGLRRPDGSPAGRPGALRSLPPRGARGRLPPRGAASYRGRVGPRRHDGGGGAAVPALRRRWDRGPEVRARPPRGGGRAAAAGRGRPPVAIEATGTRPAGRRTSRAPARDREARPGVPRPARDRWWPVRC